LKYFYIALLGINFSLSAIYYGQEFTEQDKFVNEYIFKNKRNGVFVDIGAHNGITYSNTYFFESELDWTGICIEPIPERFVELQKNRKCKCIQGCISDIPGKSQLLLVSSPCVNTEMLTGLLHKYHRNHLERVKIEIARNGGSYQLIDVECYLLNDVLEGEGIQHVDLLSLDTEGGEFDILSSIDFSKYQIDVIVVENNYRDPRFVSFLAMKGFVLIATLADQDLVFVRQNSF
jgi:FkbM family methyltransferase